MKKQLSIFIPLLLLLAACGGQAGGPDLFVEAARNRATADAAQLTATWQEKLLTATARAPILEITQTAAALSVVGTQQVIYGTATAQAWTPTPSPSPTTDFTATVSAAQAIAISTQIANNTARDNLQLEREKSLNNFYAQLPVMLFVVLMVGLMIGVVWVARRERYKPVPVDGLGNPLPVIDVVEGTITDIDRSPNHRTQLGEHLARRWLGKRLGLLPLLPPVTAERQDATTARDQMIELATRGAPGPARAQVTAGELTAQPNLQQRFRILPEGGEHLDILDGEIIQVLDEDWRRSNEQLN